MIDFVEEEMVLANDPLFSRETLKDYPDKHDRSSKKRLMKSYAAQTLAPVKKETEYIKQSNCPTCGGKHDMDNCTVNKQTVEERNRTLAKKKLCYGCYMPITADHNARTCSNRRVCEICNQKHPTGLHVYVPKKEVEVTLQLHRQLILKKMTTLEQAVYQFSTNLLRCLSRNPSKNDQHVCCPCQD